VPELPEVETIARDLRALVVGRTITGARTDWPRLIAYPDPAGFVAGLHGRRVATVWRRAKWLLLDLDGGGVLAIQVRMTGQLFVVPAERPVDRHVHLVIDLDDGRQLRLRDMRKFARVGLYRRDAVGRVVSERRGPDGVDESVDLFARHGPEPLGADFTLAQFRTRLRARRGRLKPLLLDQSFLAGVGNIYADEALWRARLHPLRTVATLRPGDEARLYGALREVLAEAVARRGSSIDDYTAPSGDGEMQGYLRAYQRTGLPCLRCGRPMRRIAVGQRGTHFCSWCQRLPAADRSAAAALLAAARGTTGNRVRRGPRWTELPGEGTLGLTPREAAMAAARARTGTGDVGGNTASEALRAPAGAARTRRAAATRRRAARGGVGA
jgi:formamidopyrimidine-DNA glycosylase